MTEETGSGWIPPLLEAARRAGEAILEVRRRDPVVTTKADRSPVTEADHRSQEIILDALHRIAPGVPAISEERQVPPLEVRGKWERLWLVDPLDGTWGFVNGKDDFAINIALIVHRTPVLGLIHQPTTDASFVAVREATGVGWRCFSRTASGTSTDLLQQGPASDDCLRVVVSSHYGDSDLEYLPAALRQSYSRIEVVKLPSSLKFCRMAAGAADFYVRHAPTCEWDTAAGQALLEAVGGGICDFSGNPLAYNGRSSVINPGFYAWGPALAHMRWL